MSQHNKKFFSACVLLTLEFLEVYLCTSAKQLYVIKTQHTAEHTIFWCLQTKRPHHWSTQGEQLSIQE